jgi:hypothetical protein
VSPAVVFEGCCGIAGAGLPAAKAFSRIAHTVRVCPVRL